MSAQSRNDLLTQMSIPTTWCGTRESFNEYKLSHSDLEKLALSRELHGHDLLNEPVLQCELVGSQFLP